VYSALFGKSECHITPATAERLQLAGGFRLGRFDLISAWRPLSVTVDQFVVAVGQLTERAGLLVAVPLSCALEYLPTGGASEQRPVLGRAVLSLLMSTTEDGVEETLAAVSTLQLAGEDRNFLLHPHFAVPFMLTSFHHAGEADLTVFAAVDLLSVLGCMADQLGSSLERLPTQFASIAAAHCCIPMGSSLVAQHIRVAIVGLWAEVAVVLLSPESWFPPRFHSIRRFTGLKVIFETFHSLRTGLPFSFHRGGDVLIHMSQQ